MSDDAANLGQPFFSVLIPAYNVQDYIELAIGSVFKQTFCDFEVIVIDDGSTDDTAHILDSIRDSRFSVIHVRNAGVSAARNKAISLARGKYIALLDSDDAWTEEHLELAANFFKKFPEYAWYIPQIKRTMQISELDLKSQADEGSVEYSAISWFLEGAQFVMCSSVIIKRTELPDGDFFPVGVKMFEDNIAFMRFACRHPMIGHVNRMTSYYRIRPDSATMQYIALSKGCVAVEPAVFFIQQEIYESENINEDIKLFIRYCALYNWWDRIRKMSMLPWINEIKHRKPVSGLFLTWWLIIMVQFSELLCRIVGKPVRVVYNKTVRKMQKEANKKRVKLSIENN